MAIMKTYFMFTKECMKEMKSQLPVTTDLKGYCKTFHFEKDILSRWQAALNGNFTGKQNLTLPGVRAG